MRKITRLLGLLFCFVLLTNSWVYPVFAQDYRITNHNELIDAVKYATNGSIITLDDNFYIDKSITLTLPTNAEITIDGNGVNFGAYSLTINGSNSKSTIIKNLEFNGGKPSVSVQTSSRLTFDNILIENSTSGGHGGALSFIGSSNLTITNSTFRNNTQNGSGYSGGALGTNDLSGSLTIENTYFYNNQTTTVGSVFGGEGGAISILRMGANAKLTIKDSYFDSNKAVNTATGSTAKLADGGAISVFNCISGVQIDIENTTFANNIAGDDGGAILIQTNDSITSGINFRNNTFYNNQALAGSLTQNNGGRYKFIQMEH